MKFVQGLPPNIETLRTFLTPEPRMFYTYGDTIYGPERPPPDVVEHEKIHMAQQERLLRLIRAEGEAWKARHPEVAYAPYLRDNMGADLWWDKYHNPDFRLQQEVEAYRVQVRWIWARVSKDSRRGVTIVLAAALRNPSYGFKITEARAMRLLA